MTAASLKFEIDRSSCSRCDLCVKDCPATVIDLDSFGFPQVAAERESECVFCQHCLAVCPHGAVSIRGLRAANSPTLTPELLPKLEQMEHLVRVRRSVRQYRQADVDPVLIQRLLDAIANAPTGVNVRDLTYTVVQERSVLSTLRERVADAILTAARSQQFAQESAFLVNAAHRWRAEGRDLIFRGAPHLLVVSASRAMRTPQQDVALTLAYFELLAQSAGLGTVWCGYLRVVLEALPALKSLFSLSPDDTYYAMLFGYPGIRYARGVQREGSAHIRRLTTVAPLG